MIDLDNTLADRQGAVGEWAREFCQRRGLPETASDWILEQDRDGYADRATVFELIRSRFGLGDGVDALLAAYRERVVELMAPTPGAMACLAALERAGHVVVIVSNGSSDQQHAKIDALGLRSAVHSVVVSGDIGCEKPDRRIFEAAAAGSGTALPGAWMVGDSPSHDIVGGARLGLSTAWLHRGRPWEQADWAPTVTLDSLADLPAAIAQPRATPRPGVV